MVYKNLSMRLKINLLSFYFYLLSFIPQSLLPNSLTAFSLTAFFLLTTHCSLFIFFSREHSLETSAIRLFVSRES